MQTFHRGMPKIGRNDLCPCGSGRKFKRCHGNSRFELPFLVQKAGIEKRIQDEAKRLLEEKKAHELQRQKQQGLGRPIISIEHQGYRFVAVGSRMHYSKNWKTFTDFLADYIKMTIGAEWGNAELKKPFEERHPVIQWYHHICLLQQAHVQKRGEIYSARITGAVSAYYRLAYNLYLIAHNVHDIQTRLIRRLKNHDNFQGAYYETQVAAELLKAGFELEYENEDDGSTTHCEYTATFPRTGKKFSVEAKSRAVAPRPGSGGKLLRVGKQLNGALEKKANFERVVFIDINRPAGTTKGEAERVIEKALGIIKRSEGMLVSGRLAPQAYVCLTNYPDQYYLDDSRFLGVAAFLGYKIRDFGEGAKFESIRAAVRARERHIEVFGLMKSMAEHAELPSTFDGQLPSIAFGERVAPRLMVGQRYLVPDSSGKDVPGILADAVVNVEKGEAIGIYNLDRGEAIIATCPLSAEELEDYRRHPDTFFGVYKKQGRKIDNPVELFDFFFDSYKDTPKERLIEFVKNASDFEQLKDMPQEELAEIVCERWAYSIIHANQSVATKQA